MTATLLMFPRLDADHETAPGVAQAQQILAAFRKRAPVQVAMQRHLALVPDCCVCGDPECREKELRVDLDRVKAAWRPGLDDLAILFLAQEAYIPVGNACFARQEARQRKPGPRFGQTRIGLDGPETYCCPGFWMQDADPRDATTDDLSEHGPETAAHERFKGFR